VLSYKSKQYVGGWGLHYQECPHLEFDNIKMVSICKMDFPTMPPFLGYFGSCTELNLTQCNLESIDLKDFPKLEKSCFDYNHISYIDLSKNVNLK
jgi:hypothetical protein